MPRRMFARTLGLFIIGSLLIPGVLFAAEMVNIVIDARNFKTVDWPRDKTEAKMPVTWTGCKAEDVMSRLNKVKPDAITALPKFLGKEQLYGYLKLGNEKNNRFYFVIDVISQKDMRMYFDTNKNGRLDDDGPGLVNQGHFNEGDIGFGTKLEVPWDKLIADSPFPGTAKFWFFINNFQWSVKGFSHRTDSFLEGTATWDGVAHTIYIRDQAANDNDADFTNDGFYLKLGEENLRYISIDEIKDGTIIGKHAYKFNVTYGKGR